MDQQQQQTLPGVAQQSQQPKPTNYFSLPLGSQFTGAPSFLPPWASAGGGTNSLFPLQSLVSVGSHQLPQLTTEALQASAVQALQRVKSPDSALKPNAGTIVSSQSNMGGSTKTQQPPPDSDDDESSDISQVAGSAKKKSRRDDGDNSGGDEDRYKKRREQIAAASRASRARRKRELEDLRTETKLLKEERDNLVDQMRKMQKKIDDLQERPLRFQEGTGKGGVGKFSNVIIELGKSLNAVTTLLTRLRDRECPPEEYVKYSDRLCRILVEESIASSRLIQPTSVITPTNVEAHGLSLTDIARDSCVVSILRSGDIVANALHALVPTIPVGKILIQRQEHEADKRPILHWSKLPKDIANRFVFVCDPMLGTGGTVVSCIRELVNHKVSPRNIMFINVVSCPEGLARLHKEFPDVKVVTCAVDDSLNDQCYIVPGLGDFGDRYYHTSG